MKEVIDIIIDKLTYGEYGAREALETAYEAGRLHAAASPEQTSRRMGPNQVLITTASTMEEAADYAFNKWFQMHNKMPESVELATFRVLYSRYGKNFKEYVFTVTE